MQMLSLKLIQRKIKSLSPDFKQQKFLLAVSGGADSMVLAHVFKDLNISFEIAHINYKLRGKDSELDKNVVENFCKKFNINFNLYEISSKDKKPKNSIQIWARQLRYNYFKALQEEKQFDFIVTAHHLNDQLETFIINLSKASGFKGLSGIPIKENKILRPFLDYTKEDIYAFAEEHNIEFREDLSNQKNDYLRNRIRNEITPKLLETNENFLENFRRSIKYLDQAKEFFEEKLKQIEKSITISEDEDLILSKEKLAAENNFVQFEILNKYGFSKAEEIAKIFTAENGSIFYSENFLLVIHRNELIIRERIIDSPIFGEKIPIKNSFDFSKNEEFINPNESVEEIDKEVEWRFNAEKLSFPLYLRRAEDGDEFHPTGFSGKKKVSKFLRDEKLSILARQKIWLLCDADNLVLGVLPLRQDRRFAAHENAEKVLTIKTKK